ncbi:hypothetical protein MIDIC_140014 [Alphaproteobacteria bacterium]
MKKDTIELLIFVDDFCKAVDMWLKKRLLADEVYRKPTRTPELGLSEVMAIELLYQQSPCKNFKYFYHSYL